MISRVSSFVLAAIAAVSCASDVLLLNPSSDKGTPIAVVWIVGEDYTAESYQSIVETFQQQASKVGLSAWVAIPDFTYSSLKKASIDDEIKDAMKSIESSGFSGDNLFLAAHSLGGVMTQNYLAGNPDYSFKGQVLMGSVLNREYRSIQSDGSTLFDFPVDTLTVGGTKDGLLRITRVAEAYWHSEKNINADQAGNFPIVALEGVSHAQFSSGTAPSSVMENDFNPSVSESGAHNDISQYVAQFARKVVNGKDFSTGETDSVLAPLIKAIELEGSYIMKDACYSSTDENPASDICLHGSPWMSQYAVKTLVGDFENSKISLEADDNYHRSSSVYPYHHPHILADCADAGSSKCTVKS